MNNKNFFCLFICLSLISLLSLNCFHVSAATATPETLDDIANYCINHSRFDIFDAQMIKEEGATQYTERYYNNMDDIGLGIYMFPYYRTNRDLKDGTVLSYTYAQAISGMGDIATNLRDNNLNDNLAEICFTYYNENGLLSSRYFRYYPSICTQPTIKITNGVYNFKLSRDTSKVPTSIAPYKSIFQQSIGLYKQNFGDEIRYKISQLSYGDAPGYPSLDLTFNNIVNIEVIGDTIVDEESGEPVVKPITTNYYNVSVAPEISTDINGGLQEFSVKIELTSTGIKNLITDESYQQATSFISTVPPTPNFNYVDVVDGAVAIFKNNKDYYYDLQLTHKNISEVAGGVMSSDPPDKCYGKCFYKSFTDANNYSITFNYDLNETEIVADKTYYLYVMSDSIRRYDWMNAYGGAMLPYPTNSSVLYNNIKGGFSSDTTAMYSSDDTSINYYKCIPFSFKVNRKKTGNSCVVNGFFGSDGYNPFKPTTIFTYTDPDVPKSYDDVQKENEVNQGIFDSTVSNGGFDISSLDSLFNSCSSFFDFLKKGFSILPSFIWVLLGGSIAVIIFLRIMGR